MLVSFVVGALTGVAMWFTTIQVGARTIGLMLDEFHWLWATEWVWFFALEIVAGYAFYRLRPGACSTALAPPAARPLRRSPRWMQPVLDQRHPVVAAHARAPGSRGGGVWAGFFNPSFWPSLCSAPRSPRRSPALRRAS